jgi:hypothetical protein
MAGVMTAVGTAPAPTVVFRLSMRTTRGTPPYP